MSFPDRMLTLVSRRFGSYHAPQNLLTFCTYWNRVNSKVSLERRFMFDVEQHLLPSSLLWHPSIIRFPPLYDRHSDVQRLRFDAR